MLLRNSGFAQLPEIDNLKSVLGRLQNETEKNYVLLYKTHTAERFLKAQKHQDSLKDSNYNYELAALISIYLKPCDR